MNTYIHTSIHTHTHTYIREAYFHTWNRMLDNTTERCEQILTREMSLLQMKINDCTKKRKNLITVYQIDRTSYQFCNWWA